jgi:SAM-dependent methyltransferase
VLDLACGYGRIAIELASRRYRVLGLDYSREFLEIARSEATRRNVQVEFVQGDMREMRYREEFDGVVSWANSFGYFSDDENDMVLSLISSSLKGNGRLLLDLHNKDSVIRNCLGRRWRKEDKHLILMDWSFDVRLSRSVTKDIIIDTIAKTTREWKMDMREYTLHEMKRMLKDTGLEFVQVYGDTAEGFTPEGFGLDSSMQISARKKRNVLC